VAPARTSGGAGKNHAMNTAKVSTVLDILLSHRGPEGNKTDAQRAGIAAYETLIAQLRQVNSDVLAVAAELSHGTIETV
jgi:hypothetical protein